MNIISPLHLGVFSVGLDKKFNRIKPEDPPAKGALKIALNPFLIQTDEGNFLIDTGIGLFGEENFFELLVEKLEEHNLSEHDITGVFCSHLHYDHVGGLVHNENGYLETVFPDAEIWVSGKEWEKAQNLSGRTDLESSFMDFLEARANLHFFEDNPAPYNFFKATTIGGHTEFSQLFEVNLNGQNYFMAGDVLGTRGAINRRYAAKYDFDGKTSMNVRDELSTKAFENDAHFLCFHDTEFPIFKLSDYSKDKGYIIKPVKSIFDEQLN